MKKISQRAGAVLLLAFLVICGMSVYISRYISDGGNWAMRFSSSNSGSTGEILDRNGIMLASFNETHNLLAEDDLTRLANYHLTGDYWGRTGTGIITTFWESFKGFSLITGTTQSHHTELTLTADAKLNNVAYEALKGRKGAVMLLDYTTGEILAMTSSPSVDPADASAAAADGAYINRCISAAYTPGSVFKLVTAAAALENLPNLESMAFTCNHTCEIAGVTITCSGTHREQNFKQALANSCNVAFAQLAVKLGYSTMAKYARNLGLSVPHSINGIPTASGNYLPEYTGDPELGWSGIGQSTDLVCPFSMARYVSAIANGGVLVEPHILQGTEAGRSRLLKEETAEKLKDIMNYTVNKNYGADRFPGLNVCAKTGTAELNNKTSHAWFTGFLLDEKHPYAFVVIIENAGSGLKNASSVANTVLQYAVSHY